MILIMEIKIVISLLFALFSCNLKNNQASGDSLKYGKSFYELKYLNSEKYLIEWGNDAYKNISKDTFEVLGNGVLGLINFNSNYILLGQSTGTGGANIRIILPLKKDATILEKENVLFENLQKNILVFEKLDSNYLLEILNFKSFKSKTIELEDICTAGEKSMCIDTIFLNNNQIIFQYQGNKWDANKPDNRKKVVNLDSNN